MAVCYRTRMSLLNAWPLLLIGFSVVIGPVLVFAYLRSDLFPKSPYSVTSVVLLTLCLILLQIHHAAYFVAGGEPTAEWSYVYALLIAPALFFFFGRYVVSPQASFSPLLLLCLVPCLLPAVVPVRTAFNIVLLIGAGYALWFAWIVVSLRPLRKQHTFELGFAIIVTLMAAGVFTLSTFLQTGSYFYLFYSQSIGIAYILVTFALVAIPDFVTDLFELARVKYSPTTLGAVDEISKCSELDQTMQMRELWRDQDLSLTTLAEEVDLTGHQLSELLNQHRGESFSNYLRRYRIEAAKTQLLAEPNASVLAIGMEVGFRSQSTFYAAFKAETGLSPGVFRQQKGLGKPS